MAKRNQSAKILSKANLLNGSSIADYCELPEMGGKVKVRALSGKSLLAYNERIKSMGATSELDSSNSVDLMAYLISLTVVEEDGTLMFTEDEAGLLSIPVMLAMSSKAMSLSGINAQAIDEVKSKLKNAENSSSTVN